MATTITPPATQAHAGRDHAHHDVRADKPHHLHYLSGFGNEHATEALPGALPVGQNSPQNVSRTSGHSHVTRDCWLAVVAPRRTRPQLHPPLRQCPYGLYAEQLSGTAFTAPRASNQRAWLYRIRPSVMHKRFVPIEHATLAGHFDASTGAAADPNQMRWAPAPLPKPDATVDFLDSLATMCGNGDPTLKAGLAVHVYACNASMADTALQNSDGDFLIVPQEGALKLQTVRGGAGCVR